MTPPSEPIEPDAGPGAPRAVDGRVPGRRGLATRQTLLETTAELLTSSSYRDIRVVDIARQAGVSPATFYQYFADVESAVLVLAAELAERGADELRALVEGQPWSTDPGAVAEAMAAGYLAFWEENSSLIRVIDLAALEGDLRFRDLRTWLLQGATEAMTDLVADGVAAGALRPDTHPKAVAGVMTSTLSHVAAHAQGFEAWGVPPAELHRALAAIVASALTAR